MKKHNDQYSQLSIDITQHLSKDEKKNMEYLLLRV